VLAATAFDLGKQEVLGATPAALFLTITRALNVSLVAGSMRSEFRV